MVRALTVRAKVITSVVVMAALGTATAEAVSYAVQSERLDARIDDALRQEVSEFRTLAEQGVDPTTGRPFEEVRQLLQTSLARNVPDRNETFLALVDGEPALFPGGERPVALEREERLVAEVAALVQRIEGTRGSVDELVSRVDGTVGRATGLLDRLEPPLTTLQPTLERLADTTDAREVDALVALIDHLPRLVAQLESDVLPVLTTLGSVAPDLHDLLDTSRELNGMLARMPGFGRRRREEDRQADRDDDDE